MQYLQQPDQGICKPPVRCGDGISRECLISLKPIAQPLSSLYGYWYDRFFLDPVRNCIWDFFIRQVMIADNKVYSFKIRQQREQPFSSNMARDTA